MKLFCVALLMVAVSSSQADDCEDNRPDPKPGLNKDDHPDCFKTCAEYKAMGACNSVWNTCVPDDSELAEKEINESCSCSCRDCMRNSRNGCQIDNKTLDGYTDGGRKAFCKTCYTPAMKKCTKVADCGGVTFEPSAKEWTLRKGETLIDSSDGERSALKCCFSAKHVLDDGTWTNKG